MYTVHVYKQSIPKACFFLRFFFFDVDHFFKVFIEFVTILLLYFMFWFFWPQGMWDLSSLTRDRTCIPCTRR